MANPVYKIETLTAAVLDHTITSDVVRIYTKDIITEGVGHFNFTVPTKKNGSYYYDDIALGDIVKIYFGYGSVGATPNFIGKVGRISAPLSTQSGYQRIISGFSQGEILLRRLKRWRTFDDETANAIATELATDLGIDHAADIDANANLVTLHIENETYFDTLKRLSDYWVDAANQVKADFWVDVDGHLHWQNRPVRTAGVETLTVGENIISCPVTRDVHLVKNKIYVIGVGQKPQPEWRDWWTESDTNWTGMYGSTLSFDTGEKVYGDGSIECWDSAAIGDPAEPYARRDLETTVDWSEKNGVDRTFHIQYRMECSVAPTPGWLFRVFLYAPDSTNMAYKEIGEPVEDTWHEATWADTDFANWPGGTPDWEQITAILCYAGAASAVDPMVVYEYVDDIYISDGRANYTAEDAASQASYGLREVQYIDQQLMTNAECESRGKTLLYQRKDPPTQIVVTTKGNTNILIGDRLPMTIPAEGISAANYDIFSVENAFADQGFSTTAHMINSANTRQGLALDQRGMLIDFERKIRSLSRQLITGR